MLRNINLVLYEKECVYLGHVVGNGTVKERLEMHVQKIAIPQSKKQVRAFQDTTDVSSPSIAVP